MDDLKQINTIQMNGKINETINTNKWHDTNEYLKQINEWSNDVAQIKIDKMIVK